MLSEDKKKIDIPEELKSMIPGFLSRRNEDLKEIKSYLENGNFEEICKIGHRLKGNGLSYGFSGLSEIGRDIEDACRKNDFQKLQNCVLEFDEYLNYVRNLNLGI